MKKIIVFLIVLIIASTTVFFSCEKIVDALFFPHGKEPFRLPQEFSFRVSEMDSLFITTRKIQNETRSASFYAIFSKDSLANLSDTQDYVEWETADMGGDIVIVFDPQEKNSIYVKKSDKLDSV